MANLSRAEKEIVQLLAKGYTDAKIADARGSSIHTVRRQIEDARHKLDANNRVSLVAIAIRKKIID